MSSLQEKLYNYEQTPPEKSWEKIAAALDESHISDKFPSTLYSAQANPPSTAWEKIADSLNAEIPSVRRSFPVFRYAAAAIITGIIIFGAIKWTGSNHSNTTNKDGIAVSQYPDTSSKKETDPPPEIKVVTTDKKNDGEIVDREDRNPVAKIEPVRTTPVKKARKKYPVPANDFDTEPIYAYNELAPARLADRYVMLMTPNGIVRMSKKLSGLVCCVSGQEQDEDCKDQLKKWQEKIACSPVAPSPGNFMDILNLVSSLNSQEL
ncbi:MAG: hypothetical protein Q8941_04930 [Bacteroidota bacterium]|nr:hypothetical protein [Bacteroidota bacterium]